MSALPRRLSNREWFVDRRAPDRRLQVTWHADHRTAVLSTWHGETCTGTFQLATEDAARLIAHLADGLAAAATAPPPTEAARAPWSARFLRRFRSLGANVIPLRRR